MNINDLSTQLLYTTVPIWGEKENKSQVSGTGFIFSITDKHDNAKSQLFLITNYHIMNGIKQGFFELSIMENNLPLKGRNAKVNFDDNIIKNSKLENLDIVAIPIASTINEMRSRNIDVFYRSINSELIPNEDQLDKLAALENITFIGYPSGLYDSVNKTSIIRRGITATPIWNDFNGKPVFLIDAGVFPGSSGSPVFIFNQGSYPTKNGLTIGSRILFIGVIAETMIKKDGTFLNLGVVIKSSAILKTLESYLDSFLSTQ